MNNETQPLTEDNPLMEEGQLSAQEQSQQAWNKIMQHPIVKAYQEAAKPKPHVHGPFTFFMNQNHNALRGCTTCGAAWVGSMAGDEENLRWHPVYELDTEEE